MANPVGASITAQSGRQLLLQISTGVSPDVYVTLGGLRATGLKINNNPLDITTKSSSGIREMLGNGGIQQFTLTGSGLVDTGAAAVFSQLQTYALNRTTFSGKVLSGSGESYTGYFVVGDFSRDGTHNDAESYTITLENSGPLIYGNP